MQIIIVFYACVAFGVIKCLKQIILRIMRDEMNYPFLIYLHAFQIKKGTIEAVVYYYSIPFYGSSVWNHGYLI